MFALPEMSISEPMPAAENDSSVVYVQNCTGDPESACTESIGKIRRMIKNLVHDDENDTPLSPEKPNSSGMHGPSEQPFSTEGDYFKLGPCILTDDQYTVVSRLIESSVQELVFLIGGGGVGKTHVVKCICREIESTRNGKVSCSCYTGVGAGHMPNRQTFTRTFKTWLKDLGAGKTIEDMYLALGGKKLKLMKSVC